MGWAGTAGEGRAGKWGVSRGCNATTSQAAKFRPAKGKGKGAPPGVKKANFKQAVSGNGGASGSGGYQGGGSGSGGSYGGGRGGGYGGG